MKQIISSFIFSFIISTLAAQWVNDNQYGFKINIPNGWTQESKTDGTDKVYDFIDPSQNVFIEVRAFKADGSITADQIAQVFESQYLSTAQKVAYEAYTLNNTPGKFGGYTMNVEGLDVVVATFYATANGNGYVLWSMVETRLYEQYNSVGDAVLNTFTTFASSSGSKDMVARPIFKITNIKLGKKLTADYNINPQDESLTFNPQQNEIYVIWDWEGKAAGKTMTIKWYYNTQEITKASKSYELPQNNQGYGWASIQKPANGFQSGSYYVQIDFEGKKQKRIDFEITKPASNQNSGFVISPPDGNGKKLNPSGNSNSNFKLDFNGFKMGETLKRGSNSEIVNPKNKFYPNTPEIISAFHWKGNGYGHTINVKWEYGGDGTSEKTLIRTMDYKVPNGVDGSGNFSLTIPDAGWPLGQYWVEYSVDGKFFHEIRFDVVQSSSSSSTSSTDWGSATGGSSKSSSSSANSQAKTIVLTSGGSQACYSFKSGKIHSNYNEADLALEPWCTKDPGVCGNWVLTGKSSLSQVTNPPTGGYISDVAGFTDCQMIPLNNVAVFKLKDGSYAKILIQKSDFSNNQSRNPPCQHKATILVEYPAF